MVLKNTILLFFYHVFAADNISRGSYPMKNRFGQDLFIP